MWRVVYETQRIYNIIIITIITIIGSQLVRVGITAGFVNQIIGVVHIITYLLRNTLKT